MFDGDAISTELVTIPSQDELAVFTAPDNSLINPILAKVRERINAFVPDVTTDAGRAKIKSFAWAVTKSKTHLLAIRKKLADEQKAIPKKIDATGRHIEEQLDAWRDEVRQPLTDWENAEAARVNRIKAALAELEAIIADTSERVSSVVVEKLTMIRNAPITDELYAEYVGAARELQARAITVLDGHLARAVQRDADATELATLRAEKARIAAIEAQADAVAESAQAAKVKAEADAKALADAAERRELQARLAAIEAENRALEFAQASVRAAEVKAAREAEDQAAREKDKAHRASVNRAAMAALTVNGIDDETAKLVVMLIVTGQVPAVSIRY